MTDNSGKKQSVAAMCFPTLRRLEVQLPTPDPPESAMHKRLHLAVSALLDLKGRAKWEQDP